MKKLFASIVCLLLVLVFVACDSKPEPQNSVDESTLSQTTITPSEQQFDETTSSSEVSRVEEAEASKNSSAEVSKTQSAVQLESQGSSSKSPLVQSEVESLPETSVDSDLLSSVPPPQAFQGQTVDELTRWLKNNISTDEKNPVTMKLVVPRIADEKLSGYGISVEEGSDTYVFLFRTYKPESEGMDEIYSVAVTPLEEETSKIDLTQLYKSNGKISLGSYQGIRYAYADGYDTGDPKTQTYATAWFIKDGYSIKITASWANAFKPWNPEWFDYFNFENVTL